jgi:RNA polymerase sigma factor for flagellar operon FliA
MPGQPELVDLPVYSAKKAAGPTPQQLVQGHLNLVRKIAWHVHGKVSTAIEVADLIQIGMIALMESARSFEPRGTATFATYATMRVRGAMIDQLRRQAAMCRGALQRRRKFGETRSVLERELGRAPTHDEMAARLEMPLDTYFQAVEGMQGVRYESIDAVYSDHSEWFASGEEDAHDSLEREQLGRALVAGLKTLPEREALVLQLYYVEEMNLEEIGAVLEVGAARVCQIKKAALDRLRGKLTDWE